MKVFNLHLIFILISASFLMGCEDNIPRDRPTFNNNIQNSTLGNEVEPEETIEPTGIERPSGAIVIQSNHCACNSAAKPISFGNCTEICATKATNISADTLFIETEVTAAISESNLQDVAGFCSTQDSETQVASCYLEIKDQNGNLLSPIGFTPSPGQKNFSIDVSNLGKNTTYRLAIVESASSARSTSFQLRLSDEIIIDNVGGPLGLMPVNQYACCLLYTSPSPRD